MILSYDLGFFTILEVDSFKEQYKYIKSVVRYIEQFCPIRMLHIIRDK